MTEAPEDPVLHAALETLLRERGALTPAELVTALRESDVDLGPDPEPDVEETLWASFGTPFVQLDDRWGHLPVLLHGRMFTHRLTGPEIEHDLLDLSPDLAAIVGLEDAGMLQLADGSEVAVTYGFEADEAPELDTARTEAIADRGSLVLPPGTLATLHLQPGDLLALTVGDGAIELARVEGEIAPHPEAVRSLLVEIASTGVPTELETAVLTLCAELDDVFRRPHPPFGELLENAGLAQNGDWIASAGFDFAAHGAKARARLMAEHHDLTHDQAVALGALVTLHRRVLDTFEDAQQAATSDRRSDDDEIRSALATVVAGSGTGSGRSAESEPQDHLAAPEVAEALLREAVNWDHPLSDVALATMAELLAETSHRSARPALRWLQAMAHERLGQVREAEDTLLAAERLDPTWPLTLLDLAGYASDRGDSSRGLTLLARADPYEDRDLTELLQAFRPEPGPTVGRNEPCWCGSGRKFKQCHLHRPTAPPLEERAAWLYQKAARFLGSSAWYPVLSLVAAERAAYEQTDSAIEAAIQDPTVSDIAFFEGGVFAEFVRQRGFLLPEDEAQLAEQWLLTERSVHDVTAVSPGVGLTVRDLRTGEVHEVRERTASRSLRTGQLICARVVPAGETWQIFGGIEPVALHDRDALLELLDSEPEPEVLMAFLSRRYAAPTLATGDGDPFVMAEAVVEVSDPEAVSTELDRRFSRAGTAQEVEWHDTEPARGGDRILATLRLSGNELTVNAMSDKRLDRALARIREIDSNALVRTQTREPIPDALAAQRRARDHKAKESPFYTPENAPPEVQEAMASYMQDYEQEWLDLPVPALSGLTPRQAADDPTRRDDLVRLLASFPDTDAPAEMSARRLRAALGLDSA